MTSFNMVFTLCETDEIKKHRWNMYELSEEQFTIVVSLLDDMRNRAVHSLSVIEQIQRGKISKSPQTRYKRSELKLIVYFYSL